MFLNRSTDATRQAAELYNAWRNAKGITRERILAEPELFLKTLRRRQQAPATLESDLNQIVAIARRALHRSEEPTPEWETSQDRIQHATRLLRQLSERIERNRKPPN